MSELTFIGLDVHARSVAAGVLEGSTGEVRSCAAPTRTGELVQWLQRQGKSISVAYEAGPTGYGLARACAAAQIPCLVAAPSKIAKAPGERVKTDRRDALRLAKLLRLGELTPVRVPSPAEEGARDLVRARGTQGPTSARPSPHEQAAAASGLVWEGSAWTQGHERWLGAQHFAERGLAVAYEEALGAIVSTQSRRDALDRAIVEAAARALGRRRRPPLVPARRLHPDRLRPGHRDRRLGALRRPRDRRLPRPHAERELLRRAPPSGDDHQDRQRPRPAPAGRGGLAPSSPATAQP